MTFLPLGPILLALSTFALRCQDVRDALAELPSGSVQCAVTSPPYWGLRDYGTAPTAWGGDERHAHEWGEVLPSAKSGPGNRPGEFSTSSLTNPARQNAIHAVSNKAGNAGSFCPCGAWLGCLGLEPTPELYIEHMTVVFRELHRVLRDDGTLWLNIGDSYSGSGRGGYAGGKSGLEGSTVGPDNSRLAREKQHGVNPSSFRRDRADVGGFRHKDAGLKVRDLVGIPWMLAFALRADGWYLRSEIIWHKPNPMPESVTDRPTKAHETLFLLAKSAKYFYDADAIAEPANGFSKMPDGWDTGPGAHGSFHRNGREKGARTKGNAKTFRGGGAYTGNRSFDNSADVECESHGNVPNEPGTRNKRSVWTIATQPFPEAHFATFPEEIPRTCILAGSRGGDTVLDPFSGAGTTGVAAIALGRDYIGIDNNPEYVEMARRRLQGVAPMFAREAVV